MCAEEVAKGAVLGSVGRGGREGGACSTCAHPLIFRRTFIRVHRARRGRGRGSTVACRVRHKHGAGVHATLSLERAAEAVHIVAPYFWLHSIAAQMRAVKVEESAGSAAPRTWRSKSPSPRRPLTRGARLLLELRRPPRGLK